jgi:hypothetical protein
MSRSVKLAIVLAFALVASNCWWAYRVLDLGVSLGYAKDGQDEANKLASQTLAVLNAAVSPEPTRAHVIAAAEIAGRSVKPYEKLGFIWVSGLGLQFNNDGRLVKVVADEASAEK